MPPCSATSTWSQAGTLVAVIVAVLSQIISDVGYTLPQPAHPVRMRSMARSRPPTTVQARRRALAAWARIACGAARRCCARARSAMIGAALRAVLGRAWRILAPWLLPLHDPNQRDQRPFRSIWRHPRPTAGVFLARHRPRGRDMLSRADLGLAARARLGAARDPRRLCRRHACSACSPAICGGWGDEVDLVLRQHPPLVPGDGALHHHHQLSRRRRAQHRHRHHLRLGARRSCASCAA